MTNKFNNLNISLKYYELAMYQLKTYLYILNNEVNLKNNERYVNYIVTRIKSIDSIIDKLKRKNMPLKEESLESLHDIVGARIVCKFIDDVYFILDKIKNNKNINILEIKDYIKKPKTSGYRGIHIIINIPITIDKITKNIKCEIQIRTLAMDSWATNEHIISYKKNHVPNFVKEQLRKNADLTWQIDKSMNDLSKYNLFSNLKILNEI